MKKVLYILLLVIEFALGAFVLTYISFFSSWKFMLLYFVVWAVLSGMLIAKLKKADSDEDRKKLKKRLALVMLSPLAVGILEFVVMIVVWSSHM